MAAAGAARESVLRGIEASDTFNYMQAKIVRETVAKVAAQTAGIDPASRAEWAAEAKRLRAPDTKGHGIPQLEARGANRGSRLIDGHADEVRHRDHAARIAATYRCGCAAT